MRPALLAALILISANAAIIAQDAAPAAQDAAPAAQDPAAGGRETTDPTGTDSGEGVPSLPAPKQEKRGLLLSGRSWADLSAIAPLGEGYGPEDIAYQAAVVARLNIVNAKREVLKFESAIEAGLLYGEAARAQRDLLAGALAGLPPSALAALGLAGNDFAGFSLEVKKLSLGLELGPVSLSLGRQILNAGRALVFSPADLFTEPDLSGLQAGRRGMDLARLGVALGERSGASLIAKPGIAPARGEYSLRAYAGL